LVGFFYNEDKAMRVIAVFFSILLAAASLAAAEKNKLGLPNPPQTDVPCLIHATSLLETETKEATQEESEKETLFWVAGTSSTAGTPLAAPQFLLAYESINPANLKLYKMDVKNGRREIMYRKKKKILAEPIYLSVFPVEDGLVKIEVDASLDRGEYCLTPEGSNNVYCFAVR
jgi:hypothetical protein